jgi:hypothetical protein
MKTLHEEVFTGKIGQNPTFVVHPDEAPLMNKIVEDELKQQQSKNKSQPYHHHQQQQQCDQVKSITQVSFNDKDDDDSSDNEIAPENYFFV